jgi:N-alpha-acetyltransferase 50
MSQSSILSFFLPRSPNYTASPSAGKSNGAISGTPTSTPKTSTSLQAPIESPSPAIASSSISTSNLPSQASISPVCETHIQPLKRINSLLLPINYPDSFYHKILDPNSSPNFSRVILWQDAPSKSSPIPTAEPKVVGGIVCRLDQDATSQTSSIYIQSLALLSPYRSYGLATTALNAIIQSVIQGPQTNFPITSLYAHVWSENKDGLKWYEARGFTREEPVVQDYYRKLKPNSAWILRRAISPRDYLQHKQPPTSAPSNNQSNSTIDGVQNRTSAKPSSSPSRSPARPTASYQTTGPGHEWNDLPEDILLKPSASSSSLRPNPYLKTPSPADSAASSRSSSRTPMGGRKKRAYPAAAFIAASTLGTSS